MLGMEAISAHNGWAIAIVGISIVFTGLVSLSLLLSMLPKILELWEDKSRLINHTKERLVAKDQQSKVETPGTSIINMEEAVRHFEFLIRWMGGEPFSLPRLLDMATKRGLARPHSTLNALLHEKYIIPNGKGFYTWKR